MPRVVHFEINADDPGRAIGFYSEVFGWHIGKKANDEYWLIKSTKPNEVGINGGIKKRPRVKASTIISIQVSSLIEWMQKVEQAGGKIVQEISIPGTGKLAYCEDTEGNLFALLEKGF